jgi:hypothetical protein
MEQPGRRSRREAHSAAKQAYKRIAAMHGHARQLKEQLETWILSFQKDISDLLI